MRRILRFSLKLGLVLIVIIAALAVWKREELSRLMAVNSLFTAEKIVHNFSHMDQLFLTRPLSRGDGPVSALPQGPEIPLPPEAADWIVDRSVTGMVVIKDGQIRHESYHLGTSAEDLRISWSVAKSMLSALFGVMLNEGVIGSLDDQVTQYVPVLEGTAYDGATIRNVLNMASGVTFNEDYLDFNSDINRMGRVLALGQSMDGFAAGLTGRDSEPGTRWQYVSIDTHILGMVIRGATGQDVAALLEDRIIRPLGLEAAPYYLTDGTGTAFVLGGLNLTTRDYARVGQMIAQDGYWNGVQIVPASWVRTSTGASAPGDAQYGFQWWIPQNATPGEFFARGIYGQYIYIDRPRGVVIALNSADRGFREPGVDEANIAMFRKIAASF